MSSLRSQISVVAHTNDKLELKMQNLNIEKNSRVDCQKNFNELDFSLLFNCFSSIKNNV